jgi:hypothetical protein
MTSADSSGHMLEPFMDLSFEGHGEASFNNGRTFKVKFALRIHKNGSISGELQLLTFDNEIWSYYRNMSEFTFKPYITELKSEY